MNNHLILIETMLEGCEEDGEKATEYVKNLIEENKKLKEDNEKLKEQIKILFDTTFGKKCETEEENEKLKAKVEAEKDRADKAEAQLVKVKDVISNQGQNQTAGLQCTLEQAKAWMVKEDWHAIGIRNYSDEEEYYMLDGGLEAFEELMLEEYDEDERNQFIFEKIVDLGSLWSPDTETTVSTVTTEIATQTAVTTDVSDDGDD
eukprot:COSAG05_NODE_116_length_17986_cov_348.987534_10_plen_204_part_00